MQSLHGFDKELRDIYRNRNNQKSKLQAMPTASGDYLRGGAVQGEQAKFIQKDRTNINNGYFTAKPSCSEAKRMNHRLAAIYKEGLESDER